MKFTTLPRQSSLAVLTDFYQTTMAYGYWKSGVADYETVFHLHFRKNPFNGGYSIACGLNQAIELLHQKMLQPDDRAYLSTLCGNDGQPLFSSEFLEYLGRMEISCDIDAVPEGTVVFPFEPLLRIQGPIIQCQILETPLLTLLNFQSLIATKASRICQAADGDPVLEFGLRRAQGADGGLSASRAAYIGGCAATSNILAGKTFGIPVRGTHAHSWIMLFEDELEAFMQYAQSLPNNCIFLVDTYHSIEGVRRAIKAGNWLRERGYKMVGIRLDSGDLAFLSIEARRILDEAGFPEAVIVGSNDLDEEIIGSLKQQGAKINVWGVGTRLVTAYDQPALGGVYKLSAVRKPGGEWKYRVKLSEQFIKISNPGIQQVRRFIGTNGEAVADMIYDEYCSPSDGASIIDPLDVTRRKTIPNGLSSENLLIPIMRKGQLVYDPPAIETIRSRVCEQLKLFHPGVRRFINPHQYPVGLEPKYHEMKMDLILKARKNHIPEI